MDIIEVDDNGDTELMRLCKTRAYKDMLKCFVRITDLVKEKDVFYINYQNKQNNATALKYAVQYNFHTHDDVTELPLHTGILRLLIASEKVHPTNDQIVDFTYKDNMLMYASRHRCIEAVVLCLSEGCSPTYNITRLRTWDDLHREKVAKNAFEALSIGPHGGEATKKDKQDIAVIKALLTNYHQ